jgi:hypothetical protein
MVRNCRAQLSKGDTEGERRYGGRKETRRIKETWRDKRDMKDKEDMEGQRRYGRSKET